MQPRPRETKTLETKAASLELPSLVKLAYLVIGCASVAYFLLHMQRGASLASAADEASLGLMYGVAGLIVVFGVVVVAFSFRDRR